MKRPEYVATVTRVYREAIDRGGELNRDELKQAEQELTAAFNRNFTSAFWHGEAEDYLSPLRPNNRGILIGRIAAAKGEEAIIALKEELRLGDGIEVWTSSGGNAVTVIKRLLLDGKEVPNAPAGSRVEVELSGVAAGDRVFKTSDIDLITRAQELTHENRPGGRRPISLFCQAQVGAPLVISIKDTLLFASGSDQLTPTAKGIISTLGTALVMIPNYIRVEGHTDNLAINTEKFPSNWELSALRASNVMHVLVNQCGISPERLSVVGYGEYRPLVPNADTVSQARNRRVDIVILKRQYDEVEPPKMINDKP
jgi:flagellar motor protein MotB